MKEPIAITSNPYTYQFESSETTSHLKYTMKISQESLQEKQKAHTLIQKQWNIIQKLKLQRSSKNKQLQAEIVEKNKLKIQIEKMRVQLLEYKNRINGVDYQSEENGSIEQIKALYEKLSKQKQDYNKQLEEKDEIIKSIQENFSKEIDHIHNNSRPKSKIVVPSRESEQGSNSIQKGSNGLQSVNENHDNFENTPANQVDGDSNELKSKVNYLEDILIQLQKTQAEQNNNIAKLRELEQIHQTKAIAYEQKITEMQILINQQAAAISKKTTELQETEAINIELNKVILEFKEQSDTLIAEFDESSRQQTLALQLNHKSEAASASQKINLDILTNLLKQILQVTQIEYTLEQICNTDKLRTLITKIVYKMQEIFPHEKPTLKLISKNSIGNSGGQIPNSIVLCDTERFPKIGLSNVPLMFIEKHSVESMIENDQKGFPPLKLDKTPLIFIENNCVQKEQEEEQQQEILVEQQRQLIDQQYKSSLNQQIELSLVNKQTKKSSTINMILAPYHQHIQISPLLCRPQIYQSTDSQIMKSMIQPSSITKERFIEFLSVLQQELQIVKEKAETSQQVNQKLVCQVITRLNPQILRKI